MHHFRERLREEERRRDEEMLQSSDSWRSGLQNGHTDNGVGRGANRLGIRSPTDDLMLDEPIVRLGRRGVAARMRADTDPLGLRSAITDHGTATRTRRRASPASEDHGPTLEELLEKKTEARRQERLSEQRQLEIADTLYPFGRRPESRMAMMSGSRRPSAASPIEEIERYSPWGKGVGNPSPNQNFRRRSRERTIAEEAHSTDQPFLIGSNSSARLPSRARSRGSSDVVLQEDGDADDTFPWARHRVSPRERPLAGMTFREKMGWSTSDHNPKKTKDEMREYLESLKDEMEQRRNKLRDESLQEANSNVRSRTTVDSSDLATAMHNSLVGKVPISTALRRRTRHLM
ncbi:uncharacterized protein LOC119394461 [Rhipicephalus sanguineus]|uniref:uncharacterized protein LOC119394461 n=1 Tax=Rhipicephalus sanguineus TaxID=34632 RepID=UPI0018947DD0|nr:uncharacterized protein LOC119394461 [Rhipicephalus sanguineus]